MNQRQNTMKRPALLLADLALAVTAGTLTVGEAHHCRPGTTITAWADIPPAQNWTGTES
jgi:hypothetical protein